MTLKKLYGAALTTPLSDTVDTQAIGVTVDVVPPRATPRARRANSELTEKAKGLRPR